LAASLSVAAQTPSVATPGKEGRDLQVGTRRWKGDFEAMKKRRIIRALVPYSKTFYYVENGRQRGISYDIFKVRESVKKPS